ncbi:RHS repeat-associated core domain-containing protein [Oscillospiraceae bacterium PP1C4]
MNHIHLRDGQNIVAEVGAAGKVNTRYLRGLNLVTREIDTERQSYLFNAHGDVVQLVDAYGNIKSYQYDAFGNEENPEPLDSNPFRYCGEYFDKETGEIYLRPRNYSPTTGRFLMEDTHWNPTNMIYGDNPLKINERKADPNDPLGLNTYTYVPDINAMMQSGNRYVYGMNNPIMYIDQNGNFVITTTVLLIAGGAALFGTIGGFVGNHIPNQKGATGWNKVGYIAGGAAVGAIGGAALGVAALPVATAAGFGGLSFSAAGVSTIAAAGTSFGTMGTLIAQNPNITVNWSTYAQHGLSRMAERGITQQMVNTWVATGKVLQQGADKFAYITREGMAVVNSAGETDNYILKHTI